MSEKFIINYVHASPKHKLEIQFFLLQPAAILLQTMAEKKKNKQIKMKVNFAEFFLLCDGQNKLSSGDEEHFHKYCARQLGVISSCSTYE